MDAGVSAGLTGLLRAATAVEEELALIVRARPRDGFPHRELVDALPSPGDVRSRALTFGAEIAGLPPEHAVTTLGATSKELSSLHIASQGIRNAVEWAPAFTAIDWWVARRLMELGLPTKRVLVAPGRLGDYSIERTSRVREVLVELGEGGRLLADDNDELAPEFQQSRDRLADIHVLRVPASDGISPAWHPLVLGHELAHLKHTDTTTREWVSSLNPEGHSELVLSAIAAAKEYGGKSGVELVARSAWLDQLEKWLIEIACDSVAVWFYGPAGRAALETILAAYTVSLPTPAHPQPALRLAIQGATATDDIVAFKPTGDTFSSPQNQATAALIELAVQLRDDIWDKLQANVGGVDAVANDVAAKVAVSLERGLVPSSSDWPTGDVGPRATAIESGLVRAMWIRREALAANLPESDDVMTRDVRFISQAIDALEFAARFDAQRDELGVEARERMPLPNVLWLGTTGVRSSEGQEKGVPAYDLRLGRVFTVFQRASISDINSLTGDADLSVIQREVQVGWGDHFILHPSELVLATTFESLRLDNDVSAQVLSRSSVGRLGLLSATAVQVQPGFRGCLTLELVNLANVPLRLTPGQRVAQIVPLPALGVTPGYAGEYQDAGPKPGLARAQRDWDAEVLWRMSARPL